MSLAPPTSSANAAWQRIAELVELQRCRAAAVARELDLSPPQLFALRHLDPAVPRPMGELAGALACDNSNVTGIIDRLERRGLVERRPSPDDRRVRILALTAEGERLRAAVAERLAAPPAAFDGLDPEEQRLLAGLLDRVLAGVRSCG
ncbi:MarR family winged helix-turn-helix transcriptional regulator [Patulibacter defluvii]|uniref:MarR family winged helix-turn-helix transcriptional regulator n=1 Tax=Patulibacter defluvii TaxID=3095358 RepID=UPI002A74C81C|nr:MarR family transcriptional regulator [Patulibacter sp. DM4]